MQEFANSSLVLWFRKTETRMYGLLVFAWTAGIFLILLLFSGGPGIAGAFIFPIFMGVWSAFYILAITRGPIARWDEKFRNAIANGTFPWWMGLVRLSFVVLPYYFYGWIPEKLLESVFLKYVLADNGQLGDSRHPESVGRQRAQPDVMGTVQPNTLEADALDYAGYLIETSDDDLPGGPELHYSTAVYVLATLGKTNEARELISSLNNRDDYWEIVNFTNNWFAQNGQINDLISFTKMFASDDDTLADLLIQHAQSLSAGFNSASASLVLDEAQNVVSRINDVETRSMHLSSIAEVLAELNKSEQAIEIAKTIESAQGRSSAMNRILPKIVAEMDRGVISEMVESIPEEETLLTTINLVCHALITIGRIEDARTLSELRKSPGETDEHFSFVRAALLMESGHAYESLGIAGMAASLGRSQAYFVTHLASLGKLKEAVRIGLWHRNRDYLFGDLPHEFAEELDRMISNGEHGQLVSYCGNARPNYLGRLATIYAAKSLAATGNIEKAQDLARTAETQRITAHESIESVAAAIVSMGLASAERETEAKQWARESLAYANLISEEREKDLMSAWVCWALATAGEFDEASRFADSLSDRFRSQAHYAIVEGQLAGRHLEMAVETSNKIVDPFWQCRSQAKLAVSLALSGSADQNTNFADQAVASFNAIDNEYDAPYAICFIAKMAARLSPESSSNSYLKLAVDLLSDFPNRYEFGNDVDLSEANACLCEALSQAGEEGIALNHFVAASVPSDVLSALSSGLAQAGEFEQSFQVAAQILTDDEYDSTEALKEILKRAPREPAQLNEVASRALEASKHFETHRPDIELAIALTLIDGGLIAEGLSVARESAKNGASFHHFVRTTVSNGGLDVLIEFNQREQDEGDRIAELLAISRALHEQGQSIKSRRFVRDAERLAQNIDDPLDGLLLQTMVASVNRLVR